LPTRVTDDNGGGRASTAWAGGHGHGIGTADDERIELVIQQQASANGPIAPRRASVVPTTGTTSLGPVPAAADALPPLILVVDDDPDLRRLFLFRRRAAGFRVILAEDGEQGMARARDDHPALIFCDLHMPLVPGELFILSLRLDPRTAEIPIAVVTGSPERLGPEHQVAAVLNKPVDADLLIGTARRLTGTPIHPGA